MLVLLVDDEQSLLDIFSQTLIAGGMQVITANNGKDGLEKAKSQKPDIVLLDQVLPDMNGNQVLSLMKKDPDVKNIPVAMLSNFTQNGLVDEAINAGALDYILKYQIEPKDLIAKVNDLIREHASKPGITDERINVGTTNPETPIAQPFATPITNSTAPVFGSNIPVSTPSPMATSPQQNMDQVGQGPQTQSNETKPDPLSAAQESQQATLSPMPDTTVTPVTPQTEAPTGQMEGVKTI